MKISHFFLAVSRGIDGKPCDQFQTGSGAITSPGNYPIKYNNNVKCKYTLKAEPGKIIKITFDEFDVETSSYCEYDSLTISGRKHCGHSSRKAPKEIVMIFAESTELLWSTDNAVSSKGFSFSWESVDYPVQLQSAAAFNSHMQLFLMQLNDHVISGEWRLRRHNRLVALNEIWDKVKIAEEHFQTEGNCKNEINYELFDFKVFDPSQLICTNIQNFASNARQFLENFVCLEQAWRTSDAFRYRTLKEWHKRVDEIENLCRSEVFNKHKPWALSALMKVDDEVEAIFEEIKADLRARTGITGDFKIHGYKTNHNGTTYFIRCSAAGEFVHAEVYVPLPLPSYYDGPPYSKPAYLQSVLFGESVNKFTAINYW